MFLGLGILNIFKNKTLPKNRERNEESCKENEMVVVQIPPVVGMRIVGIELVSIQVEQVLHRRSTGGLRGLHGQDQALRHV